MKLSDDAREPREGEQGANKPKYLVVRDSGIYWFKRKVPVDVKGAFPEAASGTLWQSLSTRELDTALAKLPEKIREFDTRCRKERAKTTPEEKKIRKARQREGGTDKYLLTEHVLVILERYYHSMLVMDDTEREELAKTAGGDRRVALELLRERRSELEEYLREYQLCSALQHFDIMEETAAGLLHVDGLIAPPGSNAHKDLVAGLLTKEIELLEEQLRRLEGKGTGTPNERNYPAHPRALKTMRDAFASWSTTQTRPKTVDTYDRFVAEFEAVVGPVPLVGLTKDHVYQYRDWLLEKSPARETAKNRIRGLATLFNHLAPQGQLERTANPFEGIALHEFARTPTHLERRSFTVAELQQLFSSELYRGKYIPQGQTREALYWAPLMATFSGGRIEEIAQLRADDIAQIEGVWVSSFWEAEEGQKLKTASSFRRVPLHDELIRCGLVQYAKERQKTPRAMLFESLENNNKYESWSAALSKSFAYYSDRIGLTDKRLDFHSFRYCFRQQCTNCGIEAEARDALTGHWGGDRNAGSTYLRAADRQYPFPALVNAMKQFRYSDLDLSHLYRA